jgi:hypothetical protein
MQYAPLTCSASVPDAMSSTVSQQQRRMPNSRDSSQATLQYPALYRPPSSTSSLPVPPCMQYAPLTCSASVPDAMSSTVSQQQRRMPNSSDSSQATKGLLDCCDTKAAAAAESHSRAPAGLRPSARPAATQECHKKHTVIRATLEVLAGALGCWHAQQMAVCPLRKHQETVVAVKRRAAGLVYCLSRDTS